jgi:hypothetical protein
MNTYEPETVELTASQVLAEVDSLLDLVFTRRQTLQLGKSLLLFGERKTLERLRSENILIVDDAIARIVESEDETQMGLIAALLSNEERVFLFDRFVGATGRLRALGGARDTYPTRLQARLGQVLIDRWRPSSVKDL